MKKALTQEQVKQIEKLGKINLIGDKITYFKAIVPEEGKPFASWVFNHTYSKVFVPDLDLDIEPKNLVYLPKFYNVDQINNSKDLKTAIFQMRVVKMIGDPTKEISAEDMYPKINIEKEVAEKYGGRTVELPGELVEPDNPYDAQIGEGGEIQKREDEFNQRLSGRSTKRAKRTRKK